MSTVEKSIAFVLDSSRTRAVGLAFLVTDRLLLTCAHVVNASLGRGLREPTSVPASARVPLDFALLGSSDDWFDLSAKVVGWQPSNAPLELDEDIAVLRLGQDLRSVGAVPLKIRSEPDVRRLQYVQMWGAAAGERAGRHALGRLMGPVGKNRLQVNEEAQGKARVGLGFSGGPAWHPHTGEVVGMLQAVAGNDGHEVFIIAGSLLELAVTTTKPPRRGELIVVHDHGEVDYDGVAYSLRHSRLIRNDSPTTHASYEVKVSVNRLLNHDPDLAAAYYGKHPLVADDLTFAAWCLRGSQRREMSCAVRKQSPTQIDYTLYFAEGDELRPGEGAGIEYSYTVGDQQWGRWYQRNVRRVTDRLSLEARLPTALEPECWGMTELPSRTGLEPLPHLTSRPAGEKTVYSWDRNADEDDLRQGRRVRLDWFFWRQVLDRDATADPSEAMARFGILQVHNPVRGRKLPNHLPAGARIRPIDTAEADERELAERTLEHLRRVAGWVARYHTFRPDAAMGLAAPQLGITYRIAIIRRPRSNEFIELLNPRIISASSRSADDYEGCLSFFDVRGMVRRPVSVTVRHDRLDGGPLTTVFTGALARSVQHEIDHLDGKMYTDEDRMPAGMNPIPMTEYHATRHRIS
jgi:peptide deformylase